MSEIEQTNPAAGGSYIRDENGLRPDPAFDQKPETPVQQTHEVKVSKTSTTTTVKE